MFIVLPSKLFQYDGSDRATTSTAELEGIKNPLHEEGLGAHINVVMLRSTTMRQQARVYPPREAASGEKVRSKLDWPCRPYNLSESSAGAPTKTAIMAIPGISPQPPHDASGVRRRARIHW